MNSDKIIQTIKKVLELSKNNPSEEEAKAAALKAQELLAKYHIDIAEVEGIDSDKSESIEEIKVNVPAKKWKYTLARIVANNFRCMHFYYGKSVVVFYGHKTDALVASETFLYLFQLGNKLAGRQVDKVFAETGTSTGVYNSFVLGYCDGIKTALDKQCTALMLVVPEDVSNGYNEITKNSKTMRSKGLVSADSESYSAGVLAGRDAIGSRKLEG